MEKLNIAEILKDCPKGMELNCTMYEDVYFDYVDKQNLIHCYIQRETHKTSFTINQHGTPDSDIKSKCVIFPKGKTTWEGFQRPFKDGDVVITKNKGQIFIFKEDIEYNGQYYRGMCYFGVNLEDGKMFKKGFWNFTHLATEEEKQKLFDAIKANGYKWNTETKTLVKLIVPKFKVGDKVRYKGESTVITITDVKDNYYFIKFYNPRKNDYQTERISFKDQDDCVLVSNKFDITTLKPFESRVLVRSSMDGLWKPAVFGFRNGYNDNAFYIVGGSCWKQCIPYLNNEHLCGTTNDCDDFYKTWE